MTLPTASVVVASLGRPRELARCVMGLVQLSYRPMEVVVVACAAGRAALAGRPEAPWLRVLPNPGTGIAEARNVGISAAAGTIVAFLDDDAVPEPTWLGHLVGAMEGTEAAAATGFVRGRNGISFQWRGRLVRRDGFPEALPVYGDAPRVPPPGAGIAMLEGTNMAIRRDALVRLGGFDPRYRFYLDDADLAVRLSDAGMTTAVAPLAQVHHGFAASARRRADRMPTDLFDVGRSLAIFLSAHLWDGDNGPFLALHREAERRRLVRYLVSGHAEPRDVRRLLARFDAGALDGARCSLAPPRRIALPGDATFRTDPPRPARVLAGRVWSRRSLRRQAAEAAAGGDVVSLFLFSPTALYHHVTYRPEGVWEQSGGLFGRSDRSEALFRVESFPRRLAREVARVAKVRGLRETDP